MAVRDHPERSLADLVGELMTAISTLFRQELALARAEMSEKASQAGSGAVSIAIGGVIGLVALLALVQALIIALTLWFDINLAWSSLIVGVVLAIVALILVMKGRSSLRPQNLAPTRTAQSLRKDRDLVKEQIR